jgi:Tfp pilus assembly protein PilF
MVNNNLQRLLTKASFAFCFLAGMLLSSVHTSAQAKKTAPANDTLSIAHKLISQKKYRKANRLLRTYRQHHPKDANASWIQAQAYLWLSNHRQSGINYQRALTLQPDNDYLRLNYISGLLDMNRFHAADSMLSGMEAGSSSYSDIYMLRARQKFWTGDLKAAAAYIKQAMEMDGSKPEVKELSDEIAIARAPLVSLNSSYYSDDQPLNLLTSSIRYEQYLHRLLTLYASVDEYHFSRAPMSDALWGRVGDKLFFPAAGIKVNAAVGMVQYPYKNSTSATGELDINTRISHQFDLSLNGSYVPYFDTKTSTDTNIAIVKTSAMLNWHLRKWSGQAAVINSNFSGNNVHSLYAWVLAPIASFPFGQLNIGYSSSYSNSDKNSYTATVSLAQILAAYTTGYSIPGVYTPYFTPNNLYVNSGLLALTLNFSRHVSLNLNGDIGYGTIENPYLFLNKDNSGQTYIAKGYTMEYFTPSDVSANLNFKIAKTWLVSARYMYRNTYFFTSNYAGVGITKSFVRLSGNKRMNGKSSFSKSINDIDDDLQGLYSNSTPGELKAAVDGIKNRIKELQSAQQKWQASETVKGGDEADQMRERYDALGDMLNDLNSIDLNDLDKSSDTLKHWLTMKLYELSSVKYNGPVE